MEQPVTAESATSHALSTRGTISLKLHIVFSTHQIEGHNMTFELWFIPQVSYFIITTTLRACSHFVPEHSSQVLYLLATNVNTPFLQVPMPEFAYSASTTSQHCIRAQALCPHFVTRTCKTVVFSLVPSKYCTQALCSGKNRVHTDAP